VLGTVLNDSSNSFTPYFLTANHCIDVPEDPVGSRGIPAAAAGTINTYWFFQAATCGSHATPAYTLLPGGAKLVARSLDYDWALVRLNLQPPYGTTYAAWNAGGPIASGQAVHGIHHPLGDLKKASAGATQGYQGYSDGSTFLMVRWSSGVTDFGSSGSGLFTPNPLTGHYELRGALSGGESTCTLPHGIDEYARFDKAYPLIKPALAPSAQAATVPVVEFYNALADQYFITADPFEIAGRDNSVPAGWVRTGYRFLAYADAAVAPAGAQPVCRLYAPPPHGDVRFYSASAEECSAMLAQDGGHWLLESAAAFHIPVPGGSSAACPAGTQAVHRFADAGVPPRRRYAAEVDLRDALRGDAGWTAEGGKAPNCIVSARRSPTRDGIGDRDSTTRACGGVPRRAPSPAGGSTSRTRARSFSPRGSPTGRTASRGGSPRSSREAAPARTPAASSPRPVLRSTRRRSIRRRSSKRSSAA
jgi:hypothetical protein